MRVPGFVDSDLAVGNIATRSALHLTRLLGPYSRFMWFHPGPTIYYISVPLFAASGQRYGGLTATATLLNLVCAVGIVAIVGRVGSRRDAIAAGAVMLLYLSFGSFDRWRSAWSPELVILPVAAVVILAAALVGGRRWALPVLAVVGSFAVQTDVSTAPVVAVVIVVAVVAWAWLERHHARAWRWSAAWTAGALGIVWALPIYEQFTRSPGNLTLLRRFFFEGRAPHPEGSIAAALRFVVDQATLTWVPGLSFAASVKSAPATSWRWVVLAAVVALAVAGCAVAWRRGDRFRAALRGLPVVALVVAGYSATRVPGQLGSYLTVYSLSVGLCLWIAAGSTIVELLGTGIRRLSARQPADARILSRARTAAAPVVAGALLVGGIALAWSWRSVRPIAVELNVPAVEQVHDAISSRVSRDQSIVVAIGSLPSWEVAAGVIDALERDGHAVRVTRYWVFMFGEDHGPPRERGLRFLVTSPGPAWAVPGTIPIDLPAGTGVRLYEIPPSVPFPGT